MATKTCCECKVPGRKTTPLWRGLTVVHLCGECKRKVKKLRVVHRVIPKSNHLEAWKKTPKTLAEMSTEELLAELARIKAIQ